MNPEIDQILGTVPDEIVIYDYDGNVLYANQNALSSLGYSSEDIKALRIYDIEHTLPENQNFKERIRLLKSRESITYSSAYKRKNDQPYTVEVQLKLFQYKDAKSIISFAKRIVEVEDSKINLEGVKFDCYEFFKNTKDLISVWTVPGNYGKEKSIEEQLELLRQATLLDVNMSSVQSFNCKSKDEVIGQSFFELFGASIQPDVLKKFIINNYQLEDHELMINSSKGKTHYWLTNWEGIVRQGSLTHVWTRSKNITDIKRDKKKLTDSQEKYKDLANSVTDIYFAMDSDLNYTFWNKACEEFLGLKSRDVIGKSYFDFDFNKGYDWIAEKYKKAIREQQPETFEIAYEVGGSSLYFQVKAYPLKKGISVYIRDITKQKNAQDKVERSLKEKEVLLRELYHRTNNNMNVICSLIDLQGMLTDNKLVHEVFNDTKSRILSMALVHQMLYESNDLSNINLKVYIKTLISKLREGLKINSDLITINLRGSDVWILLDTATPCGLVLNELITNTFKHAFTEGQPGEISVSLYKEESGEVVIEYSDNGVGLADGFDIRKNGKMGLMNIVSLVEYQLKGKVSFKNNNGLSVEIRFKDVNYTARLASVK